MDAKGGADLLEGHVAGKPQPEARHQIVCWSDGTLLDRRAYIVPLAVEPLLKNEVSNGERKQKIA